MKTQRILMVVGPVVALLAACSYAPAPVPQAGSGLDAYSEEVRSRILRVESAITAPVEPAGRPRPAASIAKRMAHHRVPGLSVAVIRENEIEWARGYGVLEIGRPETVDHATRFQAASISKPVAAMTALRLVQDGVLTLDDDVNRWLRSWKIPNNTHTTDEKVTVRRLLSHTAGLTVHGFAGYGPHDPLPALQQILDGEPPANSGRVRVDQQPGQAFRYSGGGYTVLEQLLEDATSTGFSELARRTILQPLEMDRSTHEVLSADELTTAAKAHDAWGDPIAGRYRVYPEHAAASLWTTPADLARFAIEIMRAYRGSSDRVLSAETTRGMLTTEQDGFGLGLKVDGENEALEFGHGGSNAGFRCEMLALPNAGVGIVVMTNGDRGRDLASEIMATVANVYDWPSHRPRTRAAIEVDVSRIADVVGRYQLDIGVAIEVSRRRDRVFVSVADQLPEEMFWATPNTLFILSEDVEFVFEGRTVTVSGPRGTYTGTRG